MPSVSVSPRVSKHLCSFQTAFIICFLLISLREVFREHPAFIQSLFRSFLNFILVVSSHVISLHAKNGQPISHPFNQFPLYESKLSLLPEHLFNLQINCISNTMLYIPLQLSCLSSSYPEFPLLLWSFLPK